MVTLAGREPTLVTSNHWYVAVEDAVGEALDYVTITKGSIWRAECVCQFLPVHTWYGSWVSRKADCSLTQYGSHGHTAGSWPLDGSIGCN